MPASTRSRTLTADDIVDVAHDLIAEHGLPWFSMRKLARALGVNPMTVYLRFENKEDLLGAVAQRGLADLELPPPGDGPWEERTLELARALRAHLIENRNLLGLYAEVHRLSDAVLDVVEQGLALMEEAGYRDRDAVLAFRALFWHTVGFTRLDHDFDDFPANGAGGISAAAGPIDTDDHPVFARHLPEFSSFDGDELFLHTTRLLIAGLEAGARPTR